MKAELVREQIEEPEITLVSPVEMSGHVHQVLVHQTCHAIPIQAVTHTTVCQH